MLSTSIVVNVSNTRDAHGGVDTGGVSTQPEIDKVPVDDSSLAAVIVVTGKKWTMFGESVEGRWLQVGHAAAAVVARLKRNDV